MKSVKRHQEQKINSTQNPTQTESPIWLYWKKITWDSPHLKTLKHALRFSLSCISSPAFSEHHYQGRHTDQIQQIHTHSLSHTHTHTQIRYRKYTRTLSHTLTHTHTHTHTQIRYRKYTRTLSHTHTHRSDTANTQALSLVLSRSLSHTHTHTHTHKHIYNHMHS